MQFSLLHKEENAHDDGIWSCAIGRSKVEDTNSDADKENENTEKPFVLREMAAKKTQNDVTNFIVTGGLDDLVKVWDIREDNTLKLRHQLKGHALGVVSVAISSDGKSKHN